jgi:predicted RNase H-like HicB family nuclease
MRKCKFLQGEEKTMKFKIILEPDFERGEKGGYVVSCPSLPGCHSQGDTLEEARANIKEAITAYIESLKKHNEPVPIEEEIEVPNLP